MTTGYSGTPLSKKLGLRTGIEVLLSNAPAGLLGLLEPLPDGVRFVAEVSSSTAIIHVFATRRDELATNLRTYRTAMRQDAAIWVSWPKKSARVPTDITEDVVRDVALPLGLVDVKVCAVDEVWSGLKLMVRRELR